MVGIFYCGRDFIGISENEETAKRGLYEKYLKENLYFYRNFPWNFTTTEELREYYPIEKWWNNAKRIWQIKEVKIF